MATKHRRPKLKSRRLLVELDQLMEMIHTAINIGVRRDYDLAFDLNMEIDELVDQS